jgi:hypothetical protein
MWTDRNVSYSGRPLLRSFGPESRTVTLVNTSTVTIILRYHIFLLIIVAQNALKAELQEHIKGGGRISITTDRWSARNYKDFIAVTGHWINKDWKQRSQLLDIIHLEVSYIVTSCYNPGYNLSQDCYKDYYKPNL